MKRSRSRKVVSLADVANRLVDPLLSRRAGINTMLLASWDAIVGERFAQTSRPERIRWPRQAGEPESGAGFSPGQLVIACEGASAVFLMHEERQLVSRVNAFFGFPAVDRIRFVQKAVAPEQKRKPLPPLDRLEQKRLGDMLAEVEDPALRQALEKLGTGVLGRNKRTP
ncbi:DUF721 domain-containing protein [Pseudohoeflea coraliihabitans]|uniref:DUF721 domain-containing protein n=1 Tax=Pseudohoeflea coraliihabitans TaxID=2860393 RepID=A0ABS6WP95_9HYPH|nr:DciA family protein [Pseudohoeflea sp. DP4N28-3]MBW3096915.1 DUF721 domain-containing protein [Pseudohoeflea sp. DP4N28-3]